MQAFLQAWRGSVGHPLWRSHVSTALFFSLRAPGAPSTASSPSPPSHWPLPRSYSVALVNQEPLVPERGLPSHPVAGRFWDVTTALTPSTPPNRPPSAAEASGGQPCPSSLGPPHTPAPGLAGDPLGPSSTLPWGLSQEPGPAWAGSLASCWSTHQVLWLQVTDTLEWRVRPQRGRNLGQGHGPPSPCAPWSLLPFCRGPVAAGSSARGDTGSHPALATLSRATWPHSGCNHQSA